MGEFAGLSVDAEGSAADAEAVGIARLANWSLWAIVTVAVAASVVASPYVARSVLNGIGRNVHWLSVAAVAFTAFAAASSASRWRIRPTRLLAFTFGATAVYMLSVLAQFEPNRNIWSITQIATWPAIPLVYVLWLRTALNIAYHLRPDPTVAGFDRVVHRARAWSSWPRPLRWRSVPTWEVGIWALGAVFAVAGVVHHQWFYRRLEHPAPETWRYWSYHPNWGFVVLGLWALSVSLLATAALVGAWRVRGPAIHAGLVERARWACRASVAFVVLVTLILWGSTRGASSEPLIDALMGVCVVAFALLAFDADQYSNPASAYVNLTRQCAAAAGWLVFVLVAAVGYGAGPLLTGVFAGLLAAAFPLAPTAMRTLTGPPVALVPRARRDEAHALQTLLVTGDIPNGVDVDTDAVRGVYGGFLRVDEARFWDFLNALSGTGRGSRATNRSPHEVLVRTVLAREPFVGETLNDRLRSFTRLVRDTAQALERGAPVSLDRPSDYRFLAALCIELAPSDDPQVREREAGELMRLKIYCKGSVLLAVDNGPVASKEDGYSIHDLDRMGFGELEETWRRILGGNAGFLYDARRQQRRRGVKRAAEHVRQLWLARLASRL